MWEKVKVEEKGKAAGQVKAQENLQAGVVTTTLRRVKASNSRVCSDVARVVMMNAIEKIVDSLSDD